MKVLVDGENLRHQIAAVLLKSSLISEKNVYFKFDLRAFMEDVLQQKDIEIAYYTTKIKKPNYKLPIKLKNNIDLINLSNRKWLADLTNNNVNIIKAGYLRVRESNKCIHCGKKTLVLQEKGVDVRVATDLVLSQQKEAIVLASSDSDLIPALNAKLQTGITVSYLCYSGSLNRSVAAQVSKTITFDDSTIIKHFTGNQ